MTVTEGNRLDWMCLPRCHKTFLNLLRSTVGLVTFPHEGPAAGEFGFVNQAAFAVAAYPCSTTAAWDGLSENGCGSVPARVYLPEQAWGRGRDAVHGLWFMTSVPVICHNIHNYHSDRRQVAVGINSGVSCLLWQVGLMTEEQCGHAGGLLKQYTFFFLLMQMLEV